MTSRVSLNFDNSAVSTSIFWSWILVATTSNNFIQLVLNFFPDIKMFSTTSAFQWLHNDTKPRYMAPPFSTPSQKYAYPSPILSSEGDNSSLYNLLKPSFFSITSSFPFIQSSTSNPVAALAKTGDEDNSSKNCFFDITVDSGRVLRLLVGSFLTDIASSSRRSHHIQALW